MIDIHQHLNFLNRSDDDFIIHQKRMGMTTTVLLPSDGRDDLGACAPGPQKAYEFVCKHKGFAFASNAPCHNSDVTDMLTYYLEKGAKLIGELKFEARGDSPLLLPYIEVARQYDVPILLHFQPHKGFDLRSFENTLKKFPHVKFIGHATTFWKEMEGLTDYLMSNYTNLYGDVSAGSGNEAMHRDTAKDFIIKHQDRLMFGSDCYDPSHPSRSEIPYQRCRGGEVVTRIHNLVPPNISKKIFQTNAECLLKL